MKMDHLCVVATHVASESVMRMKSATTLTANGSMIGTLTTMPKEALKTGSASPVTCWVPWTAYHWVPLAETWWKAVAQIVLPLVV